MRSALLLLLVLCIPVTAAAERYQSRWYMFANGNIGFPSSSVDFKNYYKVGYGGGLGCGLQVTPWVTVLVQADADFFSLDEGKYTDDLGLESASGGGISLVHAYVAGRAHVTYPDPGVKFLFYLIGGLGVVRSRNATLTVVDGGVESKMVTTTDINLAGNAGFGVDYQATDRFRIFTDVQVVLGFNSDEDTVYFPIRLGLSAKLGAGPRM